MMKPVQREQTTTRRHQKRGRRGRASRDAPRRLGWPKRVFWDPHALLNKTNTLYHRRRLNPRLFRWARFCCTSRWMSSFDSGDGFFLRPTFAVALTDFTSR